MRGSRGAFRGGRGGGEPRNDRENQEGDRPQRGGGGGRRAGEPFIPNN